MRDIDIRAALHARLIRQNPDPAIALIRDELGLREGLRRVDVALINGALSGWEIKSDVDTLTRLAGQAETYAQVLDYLTIVTTRRHLEQAVALLPSWWGVLVAEQRPRSIQLSLLRAPVRNRGVEAMATAQLLWRDEALAVLRSLGAARGLSRKARWYVWERLVETVPLEDLQRIVRETLRARRAWLVDR